MGKALLLAVAVLSLAAGFYPQPRDDAAKKRAVVDKLVKQLAEEYKNAPWSVSSQVESVIEKNKTLPAARALAALPPDHLPAMMELLDEYIRYSTYVVEPLAFAIARIARRQPQSADATLEWWFERERNQARFEELFGRWQAARKAGVTTLRTRVESYNAARHEIETKETLTELGQAYYGMKDMGLDVLPFAIDRILAGNDDLFPLVLDLTDHFDFRMLGCGPDKSIIAWHWKELAPRLTIPPPSAAKVKRPPPKDPAKKP